MSNRYDELREKAKELGAAQEAVVQCKNVIKDIVLSNPEEFSYLFTINYSKIIQNERRGRL